MFRNSLYTASVKRITVLFNSQFISRSMLMLSDRRRDDDVLVLHPKLGRLKEYLSICSNPFFYSVHCKMNETCLLTIHLAVKLAMHSFNVLTSPAI